MSNPVRSKSTATPTNRLSDEERDHFLLEPNICRFSTIRDDGWAHTTPVYYLWEDGEFVHSIGPRRRHLANLALNDKVTECVDIDRRPTEGVDRGALSVVCFGRARVVDDPSFVADFTLRMLTHYLGAEAAQRYFKYVEAEVGAGRSAVRVEPVDWITWDYTKS